MTATTTPHDPLLAGAAGGDGQAFRNLVEPHRAELHAHCYRMLGSLHDAEDALQDALLRAWKGLHAVRDRDALRPWLYRIATNTSIDLANRRPARVLAIDHGEPFAEAPWLEPYPDARLGLVDGRATPDARYEQREAVELAFVAALQHLPPNQRAALILREVLGYSAQEVAETLDTSVASVNSALQRARKAVDERLPKSSQQATLRRLGDERKRAAVAAFVDAWDNGDVDKLVAILADDVTFSMPPIPSWWRGRDDVVAFVSRNKPNCPESRLIHVESNGQIALAGYLREPDGRGWTPGAITLLELDDDARVRDVTSFVSPKLFPRWGLPASVD